MKNIWLAGLAAALLCIAPFASADDLSNGSWSTTDASNTAAPPNGWPAGMFPNQVEPSARANMGGLKRWWERENPSLSTTGSAGAYVLTPSNTSYPTAYTQGEVICAKANFTSVGNDTLNVNGLGARAIYSAATGALSRIAAGTILSSQQFCASYDAALNSGSGGFQLLSQIAAPPQSLGGSGYTTLPGGVIIEWLPYSITANNTASTPAGTWWNSQSYSFPLACPTTVLSYSFGPTVTANGQFASVAATVTTSGAFIYATSSTSATNPLTGYMTVICR